MQEIAGGLGLLRINNIKQPTVISHKTHDSIDLKTFP